MKNPTHLINNMSRTFIHDIILQKKIQMKRALDIIALVASAQSHSTRDFSKETVWWILAMGLADLLRIADLHCRKVESTKWLKHKLRTTIGGQSAI